MDCTVVGEMVYKYKCYVCLFPLPLTQEVALDRAQATLNPALSGLALTKLLAQANASLGVEPFYVLLSKACFRGLRDTPPTSPLKFRPCFWGPPLPGTI